jgi:hypothetical protein
MDFTVNLYDNRLLKLLKKFQIYNESVGDGNFIFK